MVPTGDTTPSPCGTAWQGGNDDHDDDSSGGGFVLR